MPREREIVAHAALMQRPVPADKAEAVYLREAVEAERDRRREAERMLEAMHGQCIKLLVSFSLSGLANIALLAVVVSR